MKRRGMERSLADHPAPLIEKIERRLFLKQGLSLGGLALLSGCSLTEDESVQKVLWAMSRWNDRAQAWLFDPNKLAPEYPESAITQPFPFNAYYGVDEVRVVDPATYRLELAGLVRDRTPWTLPELHDLPQTSQITRHICVEGWSAIGKWKGARLAALLEAARPKPEARYVVFHCADPMEEDGTHPYYESIDLEDAFHPQTILAYELNDAPLPVANGAPIRLRVERQLGYKHAKYVMHIELIASFDEFAGGKGGYWEDQGYQWFAGI
jgi:DMSO/TMAO reductase YedYZ molybdopterin-dependent catalytic subunit